MITNGYLLNVERIERLNRAGLDHMQISIDNVHPDEVSKKSLKVLDKKLQMLAEYAEFHVNINSVVGGGFKNPNDALVIGKRAMELGFKSTIGIIHDGDGQLKPLTADEAKVYYAMNHRKKTNYSQFDHFQEAIAEGRPNDWRCRAGSRYLYICEDGLVHYCSPAARLSGRSARQLYQSRREARISDRQELLAELHHWLRPPDQLHRPLARAADANDVAARHRRKCGSGSLKRAGLRAPDCQLRPILQDEYCDIRPRSRLSFFEDRGSALELRVPSLLLPSAC